MLTWKVRTLHYSGRTVQPVTMQRENLSLLNTKLSSDTYNTTQNPASMNRRHRHPNYMTFGKDTALVLWPGIVNVFTLGAVNLNSTCPRDIWLAHWQTWLAWAVYSWAPAKINILAFFQLQTNIASWGDKSVPVKPCYEHNSKPGFPLFCQHPYCSIERKSTYKLQLWGIPLHSTPC